MSLFSNPRRFLAQCGVGILILGLSSALVFPWALEFTIRSLGFGGIVAIPLANGTILLLLIAMTVMGSAAPRHFGVALAPLVFCSIWALTSVAQRAYISQLPENNPGEIPKEAKIARTLILENEFGNYGSKRPAKLVADHFIDRYVMVDTHSVKKMRSEFLNSLWQAARIASRMKTA